MGRPRLFGAIAAVALLLGTGLGLATVARAQSDPVIEQARAGGIVGEQADGYLGIAGDASAEVRARVDQINIKRRAAYTDLATKRGVTVADVAAATACELFQSRVAEGEKYRDASGTWRTRGPGQPVVMPGYCG